MYEKYENQISYINSENYDIEGCTEASADTTYIKNHYNCLNCSYGYYPYFNNFLNRKECHDIKKPVLRENDLIINYDDIEFVDAQNGVCESDKFFTPDGIHCYMCNDHDVGMVGCKGTCTYSNKRLNLLECEAGKCKSGYIEKSKGICEPCDITNEGCIECHYETSYPENFKGLRRKQRFVCDQCEDGLIRSEDGVCHTCSELEFNNCKKCRKDSSGDGDYVCYECEQGYFLDENSECQKCTNGQVIGNNNKCISCSDTYNGGIRGCSVCENGNDNSLICQQCAEGFVLLESNTFKSLL